MRRHSVRGTLQSRAQAGRRRAEGTACVFVNLHAAPFRYGKPPNSGRSCTAATRNASPPFLCFSTICLNDSSSRSWSSPPSKAPRGPRPATPTRASAPTRTPAGTDLRRIPARRAYKRRLPRRLDAGVPCGRNREDAAVGLGVAVSQRRRDRCLDPGETRRGALEHQAVPLRRAADDGRLHRADRQRRGSRWLRFAVTLLRASATTIGCAPRRPG